MPEYAFRCSKEECNTGFFKNLAIVNRNEDQVCPTCSSPADKVVAEGVGGVLRGDAWPGKNIRIKNQMHERRQRVGEREHVLKMEGPQCNLTPNVGGEQVDSWEDASRLAASKGKDTTEYDKRARQAKQRGRKAS